MELGRVVKRQIGWPEEFGQPENIGHLTSNASSDPDIGVWRMDLAKGVIRCDEQAAAMLGVAPSVALPVGLPQVADLCAGVRATVEILPAADAAQQSSHVEIVRPGRVLQAFVLGRVDEGQGLASGIVLDVTAGRQPWPRPIEHQHHLEAIVNNLPGICYRCSLEPPWRLTFVNAEVETITGFPPREFLEGKDWESLIDPEDRAMVRAEVAEAVAQRRRFDIRYRILDRQGRVRWVYERGVPLCDNRSEPSEIEGFIFDISETILMREALAEAEERYRLVCQATMDIIYEHDLSRRRIVCHGEFGGVLGYEAGQLTTDSAWWMEQIHPDDAPRVVDEMARLLAGDSNHYVSEHRFRRADGSYAEVLVTAILMRDGVGKAHRMIGALQDLSARKAMHKALTESEALNRSIVASSHDCIKLLDLEGRLLFINEIGRQALGASHAEVLLRRPLTSFWPASRRGTIRRAIKRAAAGRTGRFSGWCPTLTGAERAWDVIVSPIPGPDGRPVKLLAISRDMTQHLESERRLQEAATVDALTGLPNRRQFIETLDAWIIRNAQQNTAIGLMILDLDGFKQINDTFGHDAGDALLFEVARRLGTFVCDNVFCARLAGDEFALIIGGLADGTDLLPMANRILEDLRQPFSHAHRLLDGKATMGLAAWPADGLTSADLLKAADMALYAAKRQHPGTAVRFVPEHRAEMRSRAAMVRRAREAITRSAITPHYQPIVCVNDGRIAGHEALLRLSRPGSRSCLQPSAIMAAFEDPELATALSRAMLESIVRDMAAWLDAGIDFGSVSLNATAADLGNPYFAETLLGSLATSGIPSRLLKLEVTETVFLGRGAESARRSIDRLCAEGMQVVLDDFGTGHASLVHLRELPIQGLKIDRSFIASLHADPRDQAVVDTLIRLGRKLNLEVVAEGVENRIQARQLRSMGCQLMQGFLYSPAVPADRVGRQLNGR
ncbi:EAL domain-containing protein [Sphingopyxis sp. LK2115]|uniref:sensor domain-containing protein n=1 Tax=Sphingopyxis sp. LK2115 TaxID=2744558 RepID=UPI001CB70CD6|nr:EAL domain-containing protein [Sphingopyxis sp. LK2115]